MATATLTRSPGIDSTAGRPNDAGLVDFGDRAVWREHTNREGVKFGRAELAKIVERCNQRIDETGDYVPVVIGHTKDANGNAAEVVGFAGPFFVGKIGSASPVAAVYAKLRFFADDVPKVRKHPRISVEYWSKADDASNGYFDPIALLGSETPELDLGLHYSRSRTRDGFVSCHYSSEQLESAMSSSLGKNELQQIVEALRPVCEAIFAEMMPASSAKQTARPAVDADAGDGDEDVSPAQAVASVRKKFSKAAQNAVLAKRARGETAEFFDELNRVYAAEGGDADELVKYSKSLAQPPRPGDLSQRTRYAKAAQTATLAKRARGEPADYDAELRKVYGKATIPGRRSGEAADKGSMPPDQSAALQKRMRVVKAAEADCLKRRAKGEIVNFTECLEEHLAAAGLPKYANHGDDSAGTKVTATHGTKNSACW